MVFLSSLRATAKQSPFVIRLLRRPSLWFGAPRNDGSGYYSPSSITKKLQKSRLSDRVLINLKNYGNKKSAKKAIRQNKARRIHNLTYINKIKKLVKEAKQFVVQKKVKEAKDLLPKVYQAFDKAAKIGVIKKNNASRHKSRITKLVDKNSK